MRYGSQGELSDKAHPTRLPSFVPRVFVFPGLVSGPLTEDDTLS